MNNIEIKTGINEEEQQSNFQNACLHGVGDHVVSVAMYLPPEDAVLTEEEIRNKLNEDLQPLAKLGYSFVIAIGREESGD